MARPTTARPDRGRLRLGRLAAGGSVAAALALAAAGAAICLALAPPAVDLAAHTYRAALFGRQGPSVWDGGWYAGHHTPAYSVLFPPLAWLVGVRLAGALAAVAAAGVFAALVRRRAAALWFAAGSTTLLLSGRLTFALGVALGLGALLALTRGRSGLAAALALLTALSSPVAAAFLALAAIARALDRAPGASVAVAALAPIALLAWAFPEGGYEPFPLSSFAPLVGFSLAAALVLPRTLRIGALLYAAAGTAAYLIHTPMGSNAARAGALLGGPIVVTALPRGRARALVVACLVAGLAWWQWADAIGDVEKVAGDPAAHAGYYRPLTAELARLAGPPGRLEIPFTRAHWEAADVAPRFPLARGWERQLDVARDGLFYGRAPLTPATYERWLAARAVRWVALPDAVLDYSASAERRLILGGPPFLRLRWRSPHWRLYEVVRPGPLVAPLAGARMRALSLRSESVTFAVARPGAARVAVEWSPYWRLAGGCVERDGAWARVRVRRRGVYRLAIRFSLARVLDRGRRCG